MQFYYSVPEIILRYVRKILIVLSNQLMMGTGSSDNLLKSNRQLLKNRKQDPECLDFLLVF